MLAAVTMPTTVLGSNVKSLPDKFQSTTATPDPPGINSQVLPGMNKLVQLGMVPQTHRHAFGVW